MLSHLLADVAVLLHVAFVLFVVFGGLLVLRRRWIAWVHLPAVLWGALVEFAGWICPLTYLEVWLREEGGQPGYQPDFIARYLLPILYPAGLTRDIQIGLGLGVLLVNLCIYGWLWRARTSV